MANLTIVIDDALLRAARVKAVQQGTSLNEVCRQAIERFVRGDDAQRAQRAARAQRPPQIAAAVTTFFDTNVLVVAFDPRAAPKQRIALHLIRAHVEDGDFTLSTPVLQQFCAVVLRRGLLDAELAMEVAARLAEHGRAASPQGVLRGLALARQHRLSIWDGLIVQAALDAGCSTLLSEDLAHGRRFGTLQGVDPLRPSVQEPAPASRRRRRR